MRKYVAGLLASIIVASSAQAVTVVTLNVTGDYATIDAALGAIATANINLVSADKQYDIKVNTTDSWSGDMHGIIGDDTRFVRITYQNTYAHAGVWAAGKATISNSNSNGAIYPNNCGAGGCYLWLKNLLIESTANDANRAVGLYVSNQATTGHIWVEGCIFRYAPSGTPTTVYNNGVLIDQGAGRRVDLWNSVFYAWTGNIFVLSSSNNEVTNVYNNTFIAASGKRSELYLYGTTDTVRIKNNIFKGGYYAESTASTQASANNVTDDSTSPDGAGFQGKTFTFAGATNFHLSGGDTGATALGTDLSLDSAIAVTNDFEATTRIGAVYDAGADQITASGGTTTTTTTTSTTTTTLVIPSHQLFSDGFEGSAGVCGVSSGWGQALGGDALHYVPNSGQTTFVATPTHGGACAGNYFLMSGTNERQPWMIGMDATKISSLYGGEATELYMTWYEFYPTGYPWATGSQKILRWYLNHDPSDPGSRKEYNLWIANSGANVQINRFCGVWGNSTNCNVDAYVNSSEGPPLNQWVKWGYWLKLNTPGETDGFVRLYKDDSLYLSMVDVDMRGNDTHGVDTFWIGGPYSQAGGVGTLATDGHRYIDDVTLYDSNSTTTTTTTSTTTTTAITVYSAGPSVRGVRAVDVLRRWLRTLRRGGNLI